MNDNRGLWRGKSIDAGEWVQGRTILHDPDLETVDIGWWKYYTDEDGLQRDSMLNRVDPSTLGECIGRCDKKDIPIFEGDIVKTKYDRLCLVVWFQSPQFTGFDLKPLEDKNPAPTKYDLFECLEVVGNKFDNPELLQPNRT